MYLTSQRVVSNDGRHAGINTFYHSHSSQKQPLLSNITDIVSVAEINTGRLVRSKCDVSPGGNRVRSYLDIVAADNINENSIKNALDSFRSEITHKQLPPIIEIINHIGIRFSAEFGLYEGIVNEYDQLVKRAIGLLENPM